MNSTSQAINQTDEAANRRYLPWLLVGLLGLFFAAPWGWEQKAHVLMHGLCAQIPSHTLRFGAHGLPFDSRMTGIYGGFASAMFYLLARGRHRCAGVPGLPTMVVLGGFVLAMAVDGFNSLLVDLFAPHLYQPDNRLRLATGLGTGVAIACVMCFLFATSVWRRPQMQLPAVGLADVGPLIVAQFPFFALAVSGVPQFALPLTLFLVLAALGAVSGIVLASIMLFRGQERAIATFGELDRLASVSLMIGLTIIGALASGRFLLEHLLHLQPLR